MPSASFQHGAAAGAAVADAGSLRPSFDVLDDIVRLAETTGLIAVRVPHADEAFAVAGHVERRARAIQRVVVRAAHANVESGFRDAAVRLGIEGVPHDPVEAARVIISRASARRAVLIIPVLGTCAWDEAVCEAIAQSATEALIVLVVPHPVPLGALGASWFEVDAKLDEAGLSRWWDAVSLAQRLERDSDLVALEGWVHAARVAVPAGRGSAALDADSSELLERLRLARRAWPVRALASLGDESGLAGLRAADLVEVRDGFVVARATEAQPHSVSAESCCLIAEALGQVFPDDPWAFARAAELLAGAGDQPAAERAMQQSFRLAADASSRTGLWRRWADLVEELPAGERTVARIRGAELALSLGDVDVALEWAERATAGERTGRAAFVLGRASLARGDLVSAEAALVRARDQASEDAARFEAIIELGEVAYAAGELERAEQLARDVVERTEFPHARLGARNLLGKLLLARSEWDEADAHFAADACEAAFADEHMCELRARVNRAIALLSRGSPDEARPMLTDVLEDAERRGEMRAVGFAISNLAVLAIERHDYGRALELSERAIVVRRRMGDRLGFARDVTNLVELRLRLGLVDEALQALRFGRQALGPGAPASRLAEVALAQARAHLARGRTLDAERELRSAMRTAAQASHGDKLGECHRLAARVALEDGVVARAEAEIERAGQLANAPYATAEVAVLRALVARAAGRPSGELAEAAVLAARETGDEELAREAHVLAAEALLTEGDDDAAASHVVAAVALREEVCHTLGPELREAYLLRRDLARLARLERLAHREHSADEDVASRLPAGKRPRTKSSAEPRFVGRHPAVRALLASVERVGRTGATVLVHGESGTGKELIAEGIHAASERASGPLVKVNCAALVESLLLSELFGHEKGAFTGAGARKRGRFERADGGTLFLDEIGDISARTQVALLRVLEERNIERVGGTQPIHVDVRIICATNRDLREMVERGEFREDLYYRLSGITLDVPPLRERVADLPLLCEDILGRIARERGEAPKSLAQEALDLLGRHRWPGNVRELENALRAASLFSDGEVIQLNDAAEHVEALRNLAQEPVPVLSRKESKLGTLPPPAPGMALPEEMPPLPEAEVAGAAYREIREAGVTLSGLKRQIERDCITRALNETGGNITRAAGVLGMKRPRLSQLVKQYGLLSSGEEESS